MYKAYKAEQLKEEIARLEGELLEAKVELASRKGGVEYECDVCGKTDESEEVIFEHLVRDHKYPDEDAGLSTIRIYK
jgi:hypothetical protein